jgi:hypothetical protein
VSGSSPDSSRPLLQVLYLFVLAIPISCVAWTITHEEIFREPREFCRRRSEMCRLAIERKFFYLFTCEYCFSHYVTAAFLFLTRFKLLYDNWMGYVVSFFALVWFSNAYMSLFGRLRVDIRAEKAVANVKEKEQVVKEKEIERMDQELEGRREVQPHRTSVFRISLSPVGIVDAFSDLGIASLPGRTG